MNVKTICNILEEVAPLSLQESYDNAGLLVGNAQQKVTGVLVCIDVTEAVIDEAIQYNCNMIVSHHPLIFSGLKRITGQNEVQRCVAKAIKNDLAIYAAHTNMDNVLDGVNGRIAQKIGLLNTQILSPMENSLLKLVTYVPKIHSATVREALFAAGAGHIGNYDSCSFNADGTGTFKANDLAKPFVGEAHVLHAEPETKIEVILPSHLKNNVLAALFKSHPYEMPAYDIIALQNTSNQIGAGLIGELQNEMDELDFLKEIKVIFKNPTIKYTALLGKKIKHVALCGGAGSFMLKNAISANADVFISGDFKYHDFFEAENKILIADIGHFESEQYTKELFYDIISKKIPTFAVRISDINTNPINYL